MVIPNFTFNHLDFYNAIQIIVFSFEMLNYPSFLILLKLNFMKAITTKMNSLLSQEPE